MANEITAHKITDVVESAETLDAPAKMLVNRVGWLNSSARLKDLISGTPFGHPAHPPLTQLVIGSFMSTTLLDLLAPRSGAKAANRLTGVGLAAFVPTALSGASDWIDTEYGDEKSRRVGFVHAVANVMALAMYFLALMARKRGRRGSARLLTTSGAGMLSAAGYLGGHMTFVRGVGVNQSAFDEPAPKEWTPTIPSANLKEGKLQAAQADGVPVLLGRLNGQPYAIHDKCTHRGCPLSGGDDTLDGHVVTCFCHGSKFDIRDGALLQGPAIVGQPNFECREANGQIEVRWPRG